MPLRAAAVGPLEIIRRPRKDTVELDSKDFCLHNRKCLPPATREIKSLLEFSASHNYGTDSCRGSKIALLTRSSQNTLYNSALRQGSAIRKDLDVLAEGGDTSPALLGMSTRFRYRRKLL